MQQQSLLNKENIPRYLEIFDLYPLVTKRISKTLLCKADKECRCVCWECKELCKHKDKTSSVLLRLQFLLQYLHPNKSSEVISACEKST